jgi:hypothetical protein
MAQGKIQFKLGAIEFLGEGEESWLSEQLEKLLSKIPDLVKIAPVPTPQNLQNPAASTQDENGINTKEIPLGTFLKDKKATDNQVKRFLATAIWLYGRGNKNLKTSDVTKALKDNQQSRLGNPADCLNKNVNQGFCEKQGDQFYVSPHGFESLK